MIPCADKSHGEWIPFLTKINYFHVRRQLTSPDLDIGCLFAWHFNLSFYANTTIHVISKAVVIRNRSFFYLFFKFF